MARVALATANQHTIAVTGTNLTDAAVATMVSGANNGVEIPYDPTGEILLRNDSGASRQYTIKLSTKADLTAMGLTTPDLPVTVANNKDWLVPMNGAFKQTGSVVYVDCDGAGKIALVKRAAF